MSTTHRRFAEWAALALLSVSSTLGCAENAMPPSAPSPVLEQQVSVSLPSDDGALVSVPVAGAGATVVDAFGPTCEPCRKKVPALVARRAELAEKGATLVLVAVLADGESTEDAAKALAEWGVTDSGFLVDRGDRLAVDLAIEGLPGSVVIDVQGQVRWVASPTSSADDIVAAALAVADGASR